MAPKTIYTPEYREFVTRLRTMRESKGKSQTELARELGWPQQRLSAIESGSRRLDVLEFVKLAEALQCSPLELLKLISAPTNTETL